MQYIYVISLLAAQISAQGNGGQLPVPQGAIPDSTQIADVSGPILPGMEASLELVAEGLTAPVFLTHAGDTTDRLFVVDQPGQIRIIENGTLLEEPFLDISSDVVEMNPQYDERGLLGLAFHPFYQRNRKFFVRYSAPRESIEGELCFNTSYECHTSVLVEYTALENDRNIADVSSKKTLWSVDQPEFNHNGGHLAFGPFTRRTKRNPNAGERLRPQLFMSLGDGGGGGDDLDLDPPGHGPIGNGQDKTTPFGAILRFDIDGTPDPGKEYKIPRDNPFYGPEVEGLDEIYAYGLRNPYRFSFDDGRGGDGTMYLGDVGQSFLEEINIIEKGGNYGWATREGDTCFNPFDPFVPLDECPDTGPDGEPLISPVADYRIGVDGLSVIGGAVYRGISTPQLRGKYVFCDFSVSFFPGAGRLFYIDMDGDKSQIFEFSQEGGGPLAVGEYVLGLGRDRMGEMYVLTSASLAPVGNLGKVWKIVAV